MPDKYALDPNHSRIEFSAKHLMLTTVRGHFAEFTGEVELADDADPTTGQGMPTATTTCARMTSWARTSTRR